MMIIVHGEQIKFYVDKKFVALWCRRGQRSTIAATSPLNHLITSRLIFSLNPQAPDQKRALSSSSDDDSSSGTSRPTKRIALVSSPARAAGEPDRNAVGVNVPRNLQTIATTDTVYESLDSSADTVNAAKRATTNNGSPSK